MHEYREKPRYQLETVFNDKWQRAQKQEKEPFFRPQKPGWTSFFQHRVKRPFEGGLR